MSHPATLRGLSKPYAKAYDFIVAQHTASGQFPTVWEICDHLRISETRAYSIVATLKQSGLVTGSRETRRPVLPSELGVEAGLDATQVGLIDTLRAAERDVADAVAGGVSGFRLTLRLRTSVLPSIRRAIALADQDAR